MYRHLLKKLALLIPTFIGITFIAFALTRALPGDPIEAMAGGKSRITPEIRASLEKAYGLDEHFFIQYAKFLGRFIAGDFGTSLQTGEKVIKDFKQRLPATVELSLFAMLIAILIGLPAGIFSALRRGKASDQIVMTGALVGYSMPIFWWGLLMILFFSGQGFIPEILGIKGLPVSGRLDPIKYFFDNPSGFYLYDSLASGQKGAFIDVIKHMILPGLVLGTIPMAVIARQTRSVMIDVLGQDYIRTAKAKGLSQFRIVWVHALRNALIVIVTVIGLQIGHLLAGAVLTETIFAWPGIGSWMIKAIEARDYSVLQTVLVLIALMVMLVNFIVDILYGWINPRVRVK